MQYALQPAVEDECEAVILGLDRPSGVPGGRDAFEQDRAVGERDALAENRLERLGAAAGANPQHPEPHLPGPHAHDIFRAAAVFEDLHRLDHRSEEHTYELQSLMRTSYAVLCLDKTKHLKKKSHAKRKKKN